MKKQKLSVNLVLQFLYQGVTLFIPLVLAPYLTRTLGSKPLGIYTYTHSIAYYFLMLAMLGISRHGQRIISQNRDDEIKLRTIFWSLFTIHIIVSLFSFAAYLIFTFLFGGNDIAIYLIQSLYVLSALFNLTWLYHGLENFKSVVIRNVIVKVAECILIFLLIHEPGDLWKYTLISAGGLLAGQAVMLPQAVNAVKPIKFGWKDVKCHIKPLLVFSITIFAVSLYTVFDKTLLGLMTNKENVAFYEYSNKLVNILITMTGVVGTVMYPRACAMAAKKDYENQRKYMNYSFFLVGMVSIGAMFGLFAVAKDFAIFYYGEQFAACGSIILTMAPLIFIIGIGDILRTQYMIPNHMDFHFTFCIVLNSIINLIISIWLIPKIGIFGAVAGTVSAEVFGFSYQFIVCRSFIRPIKIAADMAPFFIMGGVMYIAVRFLNRFIAASLSRFFIQILAGVLIYGILVLVYVSLFRRDIRDEVLHLILKKN